MVSQDEEPWKASETVQRPIRVHLCQPDGHHDGIYMPVASLPGGAQVGR